MGTATEATRGNSQTMLRTTRSLFSSPVALTASAATAVASVSAVRTISTSLPRAADEAAQQAQADTMKVTIAAPHQVFNCSHPPFACGWHWDGFTALADSRVEWAASPEMTIGASLPFVPMFSVDFCVVSLGNRGKNLIPIEVLWRGRLVNGEGQTLVCGRGRLASQHKLRACRCALPFLISNQ